MEKEQLQWILSVKENLTSKLSALASPAGVAAAAAIAVTAVATAAVAIGVKGAQASAQFDTAMNQVAAVSGATETQLAKLEDQALRLGSSTMFSATQAAEAQGFLAMAGLNTQQVYDAMPATLALAAAGSLELGTAADIASNVMSGMGAAVSELPHIADVLAAAAASSNTSVEQLGLAMSYAAPAAAAVGTSVEMASAAIGVLSNAGMQGSKAGTRLNVILNKMAEAAANGNETLDKLGVTVGDAQGNMLPLADITDRLSASNFTLADAQKLVGLEAGGALLQLVNNTSAMRDMAVAYEDADGAAQRMADTQQSGVVGAMTNLQSATEGLWIAIGKKLTPVTDRLIAVAQEVVTRLTDWVNTNPELQSQINAMAAAIPPFAQFVIDLTLAVYNLYRGFLNFVRGPLGVFVPGIGLAAKAVRGLSSAIKWAYGAELPQYGGQLEATTTSVNELTDAHNEAMEAIGILTDDEILAAAAANQLVESNERLAKIARIEVTPSTVLTAEMVKQLDWRFQGLAGTVDGIQPRLQLTASMVQNLGNQFKLYGVEAVEPATRLTDDMVRALGDGDTAIEQNSQGWLNWGDTASGAISMVGNLLSGVPAQIASITQQFLSGNWVGGIMAGVGAAVNWLKGIGGPDETELANRETYQNFSDEMRQLMSGNQAYMDEVNTAMSKGQSESIAHAKAAFQVIATESGRTWDEGSALHDRFLDAIDSGNTHAMQSILDTFETWKTEAGIGAEQLTHDFAEFFDGVTLEKAPQMTQAMLDMFEEIKPKLKEFADMVVKAFNETGESGRAAIDGIIASLKAIPRSIETVHTIRTEYVGGPGLGAVPTGGGGTFRPDVPSSPASQNQPVVVHTELKLNEFKFGEVISRAQGKYAGRSN